MENVEIGRVFDHSVNDGNEKQTNAANDEDIRPVSREELIDQFDTQISYFDNLPQHIKFSFCTNADLQYFMMLIVAILKRKA